MSERVYGRLLAVGGLALACVLAVRAPGVGDYPTDAGPALTAIAHGNLSGFFSHQPAMGSVSLFVRAPFVALGAALGDGPVGLYRWGTLPCLLAVAVIAIWLGRISVRRGSRRAAPILIVAVALLGPLVNDALYWGHPEELLTASLGIGALLAACERRALLAGVLAGLAVASKQWALLLVPPAVLVLERDRIRCLLASGSVALIATLPMIAGSMAGFRHTLSYISHPQPIVTFFTWLWPVSPSGDVRITNIFGDSRILAAHRLLSFEGAVARPLILLIGVAVPLYLWWRSGRRLSAEQMLLSTSLVLVLRCALDPGSVGYYAFALVLSLVALDALAARAVPAIGLAAAAVAFGVFDRFPSYLPDPVANAAYIAATAVTCVFLIRSVRAGSARRATVASQQGSLSGLASS